MSSGLLIGGLPNPPAIEAYSAALIPTPEAIPPETATNPSTQPPIALTIAGFDPSSGAGITADLQVFAAHGLFGVSAITTLTAQSTVEFVDVWPVAAPRLRRTLDHLCSDLPPAGIKLGMLGGAEVVAEVASFLQRRSQEPPSPASASLPGHAIPVVCDPVILSSSGAVLLPGRGVELLRSWLLDHVSWVTPNWSELAALTGREVASLEAAEAALHALGQRFPKIHAIATAGDQPEPVDLLRTPDGEIHHLAGHHVETTSTHGTGCAFSSALLARLLAGDAPVAAATAAKAYVEQALRRAPGLGHGRGPMNLLWPLQPTPTHQA